MALTTSPHLANIPEAIRIAAAVDPAVDPALKQQAFEYLTKVKELCDETWQDCLALYVQGAGASASGAAGKDGKEKLDTSLRLFCEQVVDTALINKADMMGGSAQKATYEALVEFVRTEYAEGSCEQGQSFMRNKLAFTLAHLFLNVYPAVVPAFFHPFLERLIPPDFSSSSLHPSLLCLHILIEIAQEIHDVLLKSARVQSRDRNVRDGQIRDSIRTSGDERLVVEGLLALVQKGLASAGEVKALELTELALKALGSWTPWVDLSVTLTPQTLAFYRQLLQQPILTLATPTANVIRSFITKGLQDPAEKLQVLRALEIVALVDPLETQTRNQGDDATMFRVALGNVVQSYGVELLKLSEADETPEPIKVEAEAMSSAVSALMLRFLSDRNPEVPVSVSPFVSDLLRSFRRYSKPSAPATNGKSGTMAPPPIPIPLPLAKQQLVRSLLEVVVRQLEWPADTDWEPLPDDVTENDEVATFYTMRQSFRSMVENISAIDKNLHTEVVANIIVNLLEALRSQGPSALSWQQAELAAHLVYTFGEISKANTRAAFYELPPEFANKSARLAAARKAGGDATMSSGQTTPTSENGDAMSGVPFDPAAAVARIDYTQYPLTPLGQVLTLCMQSGVDKYPHPAVPLQYFESVVRYADFWKSKDNAIQPVLEAIIDSRGLHHPDEYVRRRCFYLFAKLIKECKAELDTSLVPAILESLQDVLAIRTVLPPREPPELSDADYLIKATTGKSYFQDQMHLLEASGMLVHLTKADAARQLSLLSAIAGPLMAVLGAGVDTYRNALAVPSASQSNIVNSAVLTVHHHLLALGNFAKGFPTSSDHQIETPPYQAPFKQMTEALLQALEAMKTQRVVRDSARFAFSQFVSAIGSTVAELVPRFVQAVVTEFDTSELVDFLQFLGLLMHRLKTNAFETMDMLLLPLVGRIFAIFRQPINGTDDQMQHRRLQEAYLAFFTALMNANLEGVFITDRNQPEFENVLSALLALAVDPNDPGSQRLAFSFFAKSVTAWGTSAEAAAAPSVFAESAKSTYSQKVATGIALPANQHAVSPAERAARALPGYETFIYQRLMPTCFEVPADPKFNLKTGQLVLHEIAMLLRSTVQARGQQAIDYLLTDLLPRLQCPSAMAQQLIEALRTQQAKDFRKTFADFVRAMKA
ncbi:pre-tRNA nuclear export protein [Cryptotrichosporon argae]